MLPSDQSFQDLHQKYEQVGKHLSALMEYCLHLMKTIEKTSSSKFTASQEYVTFVNTQPLFEDEAVTRYKEYVTDLNTFYRNQHEVATNVVIKVLKKRIVEQITAFLKDGTADMDSLYKKRNDIRLDYDSHLQKTGLYESKNAMDEAMRFHSKARHDNVMLNAFTVYLTRRMEEFVSLGMKLLLMCTTTMISCELYLAKQQYDAFCMMGTNVNEDDVFSITSELNTLVQKAISGVPVDKDIIAPLLEIDPHPPSEYPVYTSYDEWVKSGGAELPSPDIDELDGNSCNDNGKREEESFQSNSLCDNTERTDGQSSDSLPHTPFQATALYSFSGTEEGDLSFEKDEVINVMCVNDRDWWQGEINGKTGIFPSNYVEYTPS